MFDSLSDQIKHDEREGVTVGQRAIRWAAVAILSVGLFGGLYFAVRLLE